MRQRAKTMVLDAGAALGIALLLIGVASIITPIQVSGGSMEPTLSPGDVCLVREGVTPKVGSIVLLKRPGDATETLHRVVAQSPRGLETQGDANPTRDRQALRSRDVQGTVVGVIPVGRWIGR